jgi:hypothetical protein
VLTVFICYHFFFVEYCSCFIILSVCLSIAICCTFHNFNMSNVNKRHNLQFTFSTAGFLFLARELCCWLACCIVFQHQQFHLKKEAAMLFAHKTERIFNLQCNFVQFRSIFTPTSRVGRHSSVGIATRYRFDGPGSNLGGGVVLRTHPDRHWGPHSFLYIAHRVSFPVVNRPGRGVDHPIHLGPRLKKE